MNMHYVLIDYMNNEHGRAFGGGCGQTIRDPSAYINSHVNTLGLKSYGSNQQCWLMLDATKLKNAM